MAGFFYYKGLTLKLHALFAFPTLLSQSHDRRGRVMTALGLDYKREVNAEGNFL